MLDLSAQYEQIRCEIESAVAEVFEMQAFRGGPKVESFEKAMAGYLGVVDAIGVNSGTDALLLTLKALDLEPDDEVITSTFTFFATAGAISNAHAKPVFVDIDPSTYNIDVSQIESKITDRTKAIVPVHLYGQCADMDAILEIADKHDLYVVEDAAQAIGARYKDRPACTMSNPAGALSFYPTKNLGAAGDGGMVVANNESIGRMIRLLRCHGSEVTYHHSIIGTNSHLDAIQAAVLEVKLKYLDEWIEKRRANASYYNDKLAEVDEITLPVESEGFYHSYNQYVIRIPERDAARDFLQKKGIGCAVFYPVPLHRQGCFRYLGHDENDCPVANTAAEEVLALPIFPELTRKQQDEVIDALKAYLVS